MKKTLIGLFVISMLVIMGCQQQGATGTLPANQLNMPNPASVFCKDNGGTLEIVDQDGGQVGICTLKDGTKCDEWAYFRGECPAANADSASGTLPANQPVGMANPASVFCTDNGGTLKIVDKDGGQIGICTLKNGTECEEWSYFRGECGQ